MRPVSVYNNFFIKVFSCSPKWKPFTVTLKVLQNWPITFFGISSFQNDPAGLRSAWMLLVAGVILSSINQAAASHFAPVERNPSVRALGMGNAFISVVSDSDALFYNPAGLSRVKGLNWLVADPRIGLSGVEAFRDFQELGDDESLEDTIRRIYGENVWLGAGGKSAITLPYFGVAVYNNLSAGIDVNNPVYPNLDVAVINDFGYKVGAAFPVLPNMNVGVALRRVKRTGAQVPLGPNFISNIDTDNLRSQVEDQGVGFGLDLGTNFSIPLPMVEVVVSGVWRDVGDTQYRSGPGIRRPPHDRQEMALGLGALIDLPLISVRPAMDFRYLNQPEMQFVQKINMGVEVALPIFEFRAGFHQGYYSLGFGSNLGIVRVDLATYGVELGAYPGQKEDRRYMAQFSFELGFDPQFNFLGGGNRSAERRLKQRR